MVSVRVFLTYSTMFERDPGSLAFYYHLNFALLPSVDFSIDLKLLNGVAHSHAGLVDAPAGGDLRHGLLGVLPSTPSSSLT